MVKPTIMNIDLIIILTAVSILYVHANLKWNQQKIFLRYHHFSTIWKTPLNTVEMIDESNLNVNGDDLIEILLFGD